MAEALLKVLASNIYTMIQQEIGMLWGIEKEMQKIASLFTTIQAVMEDAEEKQFKDNAVRNWLQKLTVATQEIDDILDDIDIETSKVKYRGSWSMPSFCSPSNILFRHKIGTRMKDITQKIDKIAEERIKFNFNEPLKRLEKRDIIELRESSSILTQLEVFGREEEKEKIVEILVNQLTDTQNISVLPIVGVGGLGKTTLAQLVFNDQRIIDHFGRKIWVCVSDDFNVKRLTKAIIESALGTALEAMDLDPLQRKLQEILKGNRFLLVLDDVWNDDQEKWEKLSYVLSCGSSGSAIVTTTRMEKVASIMGTLPSHYLSSLSEDFCWSLFRQRAFGLEGEEQHPNLVTIGKEIVKKCSGVPLAVKALGGLLRFKRTENEWLFVKESELWKLPQDEMSILPALRLSYQNLPPELRLCFAYCAIYPKDSLIQKQEVIQCWIANGIISSNGRMELEDVGDAIWTELHWRSLFQDAQKNTLGNVMYFRMHDLVHDLAESVMEGKYPSRKLQSTGYGSDSTIRYIEFLGENKFLVGFPKSMECYSAISNLGSARILIRREYWGTKLPAISAIAKMKHLRHLDLTDGTFSALPNSICNLLKLQTLVLKNCYNLRSLPKHLRRLKDLRYLGIRDCPLNCMPKEIGQLTRLKILSQFVVSNRRGYQIIELQSLNLQGQLSIKNLEMVENENDAQKVNLHGKEGLHVLRLYWGSKRKSNPRKDQQVIEALKPHFNLRVLHIVGFGGTFFPTWMSQVSTLKNIIWISIHRCENCTHLPKLGLLPSLQRLALSFIPIEYIDESQDGHDVVQLPSLYDLRIHDMPLLKGFSVSRVQSGAIFPHLQVLEISRCPMLSLVNNISNHRVEDAKSLTSSPTEKQQNVNVVLDGQSSPSTSKELELCSEEDSERLRSSIHLTSSMPDKPQFLGSLRHLKFYNLDWVALPEVLQHANMLEVLWLDCFQNLTSLPQWLTQFTVLKSLMIIDCPKLKSLPNNLQRMTELQNLVIYRCPELVARCDEQNGEDGHKIKHIPTRCIRNDGAFSYYYKRLPTENFDFEVFGLGQSSEFHA